MSAPDIEALRLQLLANGYSPIRNIDKRTFFVGWPTVKLDEAEIRSWSRKFSRHTATGLRIENGLVAIDFDVDDHDAMKTIALAVLEAHPELEQALLRWGKGAKEAWFLRCDEPFTRLHTRSFIRPGEVADDGTHRVEIFGGASPRQFGAFGPHTIDERTREVLVSYEWADDLSPATVPLAELIEVPKAKLWAVIDIAEKVLSDRGWGIHEKSTRGENAPGVVFDLHDGMLFECNDDITRTPNELREAAKNEDANLRCSASWLEGPTAKRRDRCLVSLAYSGGLSVWEAQGGVTHREKGDEPFETPAAEIAKKLASMAEKGVPTASRARRRPLLLPPPAAPREVAKHYAADACEKDAMPTLVYWRDEWWSWRGTRWENISAKFLTDEIYAYTDGAVYGAGKNKTLPWQPTSKSAGEVVIALRGLRRIDDEKDAPFWLGEDGSQEPMFACANGLLNVRTRVVQPHTPLYFNLSSVNYEYDPQAKCPAFDRFIASLWDQGDDTRRTLVQMMGYLVSGRTDLHCLFGLIGLRRGGKGTVERLVTALLGRENVTSLTLGDFGYDFGLEHLIGKTLVTVSDMRTAGKNTQTAVERLLSISGEDALPVKRKNKSTWHGRLPARFMITSNELPHLGDASTAVARRFVMLPFSKTFEGQEDRHLSEKLAAELPGVLNAALDGLAELDRSGAFAQSGEALDMVEDVASLSSPVLGFFRDECEIAPAFRVSKREIYERYKHWARTNGYQQLPIETFAKAVYAAGHGKVKRERARTDSSETGREQRFTGIRLRSRAGDTVPGGLGRLQVLNGRRETA
ncbi:hypothetical protein ELI41_29655 (plasmid) [Rhizobium leguminosarum]|uniref:phage/plasmid primase, P4 family n=1 Tax=Rhizobium leguminosarum TaxID=384 RepID=UPI00102F3F98|nr:phage/plasmid primase, P4 family [Rhizobium leguminosarum]TAU80474.1 hypothetical protein ELI41_29655 [Rhizobium leguminosarum]